VRIDALARLDHRGIQARRQHYAPREDVGSILVTDAQRIAEAGGGHQHHRLAGAREQRVGGDGGTHLHRCHRARLCARLENRARRAETRIARRAAGARRKHLANVQLASGREADDIRKRTAAIDPELPARRRPRRAAG